MNRYTLITGASSGIGEAFSAYYASQKENLVLVARSKEKLQKMKAEYQKKFKIDVKILNFDLTQESAPQEIFQAIQGDGLLIDRLINCAGFATSGNVYDTDFSLQHTQIMLNVTSLFDLTKLFLDGMIKRNHGQIINIASSSAYHPIPTMAVYAATKAFVLSFTEALSLECRDKNVQVLAFSPGATDTNFFSASGGVAYGNLRTPEGVVQASVKALKQNKISKIDGFNNYFTSSILPRLLTRNRMANLVYGIMKKQLKQ
ncbi:SDR family NAD(P)-dependent oxidoreductase [Listeria kieliensis]|uniref:Dehydrogenase n=1 Tax=Listeria kieliensis TaxID=1621700 RepID=A0A3D8TP18_9LIST|nr:SDR family oxidoreductase [Listeria kieliensis]RDX00575.1 dehydrogenase [Listeria kieliensis]